jgi:hypothetical protein
VNGAPETGRVLALRDINEDLKRSIPRPADLPAVPHKAQRRAEKLAKKIHQDIRAAAAQWSHAIEEGMLTSLSLGGKPVTARLPDGTTVTVKYDAKAVATVARNA